MAGGMSRGARLAAWLAAASFAAALLALGALLDGYVQGRDPVALLGARGIPRATAFNLLAFVLPGLLAAWCAWSLREAMPVGAGAASRIGARLVFLAALAFAAQGVLALDPADLDAMGTRLHAIAWMLWVLAFAAGAVALAWGEASRERTGAALSHALAGVMVAGFALFAGGLLAPAIAQRIAYAAWFAWLLLAPAGLSRGAASGPGSSPRERK